MKVRTEIGPCIDLSMNYGETHYESLWDLVSLVNLIRQQRLTLRVVDLGQVLQYMGHNKVGMMSLI